MLNSFSTGPLSSTKHWKDLRNNLDPGVPDAKGKIWQSRHLQGVLCRFRDVGASYFIHEHVYLDRDFVHAYASFYHRTHRSQPKHSSRIHFFKSDLRSIEGLPAQELALSLEREEENYLGFAVLRPVQHAPVSWALVSADDLRDAERSDGESADVLIRATYEVHLLGATLHVSGVPANEQDSRTGSCAQSSIWSAARHLHKRYGEPWRSVVDITNAALTPTDAEIAAQLPHGSARLSRDSMVRAMKNLGIQPLVYAREKGQPWYEPPHRIVARYLDSGIPLIVGLERQDRKEGEEETDEKVHAEGAKEEQHAVLAVGLLGNQSLPATNLESGRKRSAEEGLGLATYDAATHLLVNDDQEGPYKRVGISSGKTRSEDWLLTEATFILPAVPDGVFMKPESAEGIARNRIGMMVSNRTTYAALPEEDEDDVLDAAAKDASAAGRQDDPPPRDAEVDKQRKELLSKFDGAGDNLVARTYLTPGWKYVERMVRNDAPEALKGVLGGMTFAKFVYVTEFAFRDEIESADPCERRVRAHVVVDPTANEYDEPPISHIPGLLLVNAQELDGPAGEQQLWIYLLEDDGPYRPKVRGWRDYSACKTRKAAA